MNIDRVLDELKEQIVSAEHGKRLRIRGGGTKDFYGGPLKEDVLDIQKYSGVIDYDPGELVITARSGTLLSEVEALLAQHNQYLPFDPPRFGQSGTLGGAVASGLCGPLRLLNGPMRDHLLGVSLLDGRGDFLRFGGRVIKNVAGYDVSRFMAGSLGAIALLLDISVKVAPKPIAELTLCFEMSQGQGIVQINRWLGMPLPVASSAWLDGQLYVRLAGAKSAVELAHQNFGGAAMDPPSAKVFWDNLKDQRIAFFLGQSSDATLWRIAVPGTTSPLNLPDHQLVEWGGAQRWVYGDRQGVAIRNEANNAGGHAMAFRGGDREKGIFEKIPKSVLDIELRLKAAFDPNEIFDKDRLFANFN